MSRHPFLVLKRCLETSGRSHRVLRRRRAFDVGVEPDAKPKAVDRDGGPAVASRNNNGIINHKFTTSGRATIDDAFLRADHGEDDKWHSMIVFGRGKGGRFITAMDITTVPSAPSSIRLLWNRGNRELPVMEGLIDGLGETFSTPVLGNVDTRGPSTPPEEAVVTMFLTMSFNVSRLPGTSVSASPTMSSGMNATTSLPVSPSKPCSIPKLDV